MTVLAIDDDPVARLLVSRLFEALGCEVIAVEDGETGLEVSRHRRLSLILIDMSLPGMDGRETMRQLRYPGHPRVVAATRSRARAKKKKERKCNQV